jgi:hypothetical protein
MCVYRDFLSTFKESSFNSNIFTQYFIKRASKVAGKYNYRLKNILDMNFSVADEGPQDFLRKYCVVKLFTINVGA